jgi:hypothetical protein
VKVTSPVLASPWQVVSLHHSMHDHSQRPAGLDAGLEFPPAPLPGLLIMAVC